MAKLRKESRDKGLMEPSATEPAAASKKIGGISTGASQQSAKGVMAETQVDSDESEIGVNVKKEEAIEDDEKPAIKKNAKELTKAKGEKTITGRVSKPRAQSSTPKKKPGKAKQSNKNTGESTGQDENAAVGKHGMTPESMASNNDYTEANGMQATDVNGEAEMVEV